MGAKPSETNPTTPLTDTTVYDVPVTALEPYPGNPRVGNTEAIAESLKVNGQYRPIVVRRETREILAGNHTWRAASALGWATIKVTYVENLTDEQAARIVLADNRYNDIAEYNIPDLTRMLEALPDLSGTGYDDFFLSNLLADLNRDGDTPTALTDEDDAPAPPADPVTKPGDVWLLGPHRVVCGDATSQKVWISALADLTPKMVFTDPPYGIAYQAMRGGSTIKNDETADSAFEVTKNALAFFTKTEAHFVCCDWRSLHTITSAMVDVGIAPKACIVWDKQRRVQNLDRFAKQHEFIVYAGPYGGQPTVATDIWPFAREFEPDHPTPKPFELVAKAIEAASNRGEVVVDPFAGSGPTVIAAHKTGRISVAVELDPKYVDVICRRFQEHTGIVPVLESTGEPHDFTKG